MNHKGVCKTAPATPGLSKAVVEFLGTLTTNLLKIIIPIVSKNIVLKWILFDTSSVSQGRPTHSIVII